MPQATDRLVLWDIDGTLTHSAPIAAEVFREIIERITGVAVAGGVTFAGKTDRRIAEELLALAGSTDPSHPDLILDQLESELAGRAPEIASRGRAYPGGREAIEALDNVPGVAQTVLTGNIAANARLKLAAFGLDELLDLDAGAYGRDHNDRCALLPIAWERQQALRGRAFGPATTWIIGDTPRDLECARSGGAHCVLVATGSFAVEELRALGADAVFTDLTDTDRLVAVVTSA